MAREINFDGIVGPTHHYGALSFGNIASMQHGKWVSSPKSAALEGLKKMKLLMDLGVEQAVLPPLERPSIPHLKALGFKGKESEILQNAAKTPHLLEAVSSASSMWAANAATVAPSSDTPDKKVHFSIANLLNRFHRSLESEETFRVFSFLFSDKKYFTLHPPLPKGGGFGDEGAANHARFCSKAGAKGVHLFVYGKSAFEEKTLTFPTRQAQETSQAVARRHQLATHQTIFAEQNPKLIEQGVFHNDVISTSHRDLFLYHEDAFTDTSRTLQELNAHFQKASGTSLKEIKVKKEMLSVEQAVKTYFFNSQIVTRSDGSIVMIAPSECRSLDLSWLTIPIQFVDIRQSMQNGGGPACLRLRVELTEVEKKAVHPFIFLTNALYDALIKWVHKHYRDRLSFSDLADSAFLHEVYSALNELTEILHLGSFYAFQKETL